MPKIKITYGGFRFFFYSKEHLPMHIHISYQSKKCKIILDTLEVKSNKGFSEKELNILIKFTKKNISLFEEAWNEHFSEEK